MSTKKELQLILKTFGYDFNLNTSKDTLLNLVHLHLKTLKQGIDISKMDDRELRCYLNEYNILTGPIIGHTRTIYQYQLLKAINKDVDDKISGNSKKFRECSIQVEDGIVTRSGKILFRNVQ